MARSRPETFSSLSIHVSRCCQSQQRLLAAEFALQHIHVIFHLTAGRNDVVYNPDAPELYDKSPVLVGLTGILTAANQCGISSLMVRLIPEDV